MTFIKKLQPRAEMLSNNAYASFWTKTDAVCPSIQRAICTWLAVTKVIKDPVACKFLTAKHSLLINE